MQIRFFLKSMLISALGQCFLALWGKCEVGEYILLYSPNYFSYLVFLVSRQCNWSFFLSSFLFFVFLFYSVVWVLVSACSFFFSSLFICLGLFYQLSLCWCYCLCNL